MRPFVARDDTGHLLIVLGFTGGDYQQWAIVTSPDGGGIWVVSVSDLRDARPAGDWPLVGHDEPVLAEARR